MKVIAILVVLFAFIAFSSAIKIKPATVQVIKPLTNFKDIKQRHKQGDVGSAEFCGVCVSFMGEALDELINIIGNLGVGATCKELCDMLKNSLETDICEIICEIVGIEALIKAIEVLDPSPIAVCEDIDLCDHSTTANGTINYVRVVPPSGPQGTQFKIEVAFTITNTVATGQIDVSVNPPAAFPFGDGALLVEKAPGNYGFELSFQANPSENEPFMPGKYQVVAALCEGECGSTHDWAYTIAQGQSYFNITA